MPSLNFLIKSNFFDSKGNKDTTSGNFLIKKDKNKITGLFDYKNSKLTINKSNIRNTFMDGKLEGNREVYYEGGKLEKTELYKNGFKVGKPHH